MNVSKMTAAEIVAHARTHLLAQGERSCDGVVCLYRDSKGLKCAVGAFIDDRDYDPAFENRPLEFFCRKTLGLPDDYEHPKVRLLARLQNIHDYADPDSWAESIDAIDLAQYDDCDT